MRSASVKLLGQSSQKFWSSAGGSAESVSARFLLLSDGAKGGSHHDPDLWVRNRRPRVLSVAFGPPVPEKYSLHRPLPKLKSCRCSKPIFPTPTDFHQTH